MNSKDKEIYKVSKIQYMIPLLAGSVIAIAGIIMTFLNHNAYGKSEEYDKDIQITGPQTIVLGSIIILLSLFYMRKLHKETEELNRRK